MAAFAFGDIPSSLRSCIITDIQLERVIGGGAHGRILEAKWEGSVVAVKQIHAILEEVSAQEFAILKSKFLMECDRSNRLRHPNIVRFFGIYFPPGARLPNLVMERLHCSLNDLLERNPVIHLDIKTSILHHIGLGLRYLHTRGPPIIHRDLSSNNILISKGMEAKIADLGTIRLLDPNRNSPMSMAPGTQGFMPPEVLVNDPEIKYGKELDVFSFGCIMLHTFPQQWPTPSQHVITDPVEHKLIARSEIERRAQYLDKVHKVVEDVMVPLIVSCLENLPFDRPTIMEVCDQLETLVVNREQSIPDNLLQAQLMLQEAQSEVERQTSELRDKDVEMEALRSEMSKMQVTSLNISPKQVDY